jgi:energy-coupling factor transport system ATP-binding protein
MAKIIELDNLSYTYFPGSPYEERALTDISFWLEEGEFLGFSARTALESHFARQLNGILHRQEVLHCLRLNNSLKESRNERGSGLGLVFHYPEKKIGRNPL